MTPEQKERVRMASEMLEQALSAANEDLDVSVSRIHAGSIDGMTHMYGYTVRVTKTSTEAVYP